MADVHGLRDGVRETPLEFVQRAVFRSLREGASSPLDVWIRQVEFCKTTKEKGDRFEDLCVAYLLHREGGRMAAAWRLADVPAALRDELDLSAADYGIDIVAVDAAGKYHAAQAKFKGRTGFRPTQYRRTLKVTWRELSTFYALAHLGPYVKHWVLTTADGVSRRGRVKGQPHEKACGVSYQGLKALSSDFWMELAQMHGNQVALAPARPPSTQEMRALRLARFAAPAAPVAPIATPADMPTVPTATPTVPTATPNIDYADLWAAVGVDL